MDMSLSMEKKSSIIHCCSIVEDSFCLSKFDETMPFAACFVLLSPSFQFCSETFPSDLKPGTELTLCYEWMDNKKDRSTHRSISCSMKSYRLSELSQAEVNSLKARPRIDFSSIFNVVHPIVDDVRSRGDAAVKDYTTRFDKVELDRLIENVAELPDPELDAGIKEAFDVAYDNIFAFHAAQKSAEKIVENMKGVKCKRVARSIASVGLYVPGGTAVLPSTALMLSVPAQIAGCKTVVLATPPSQDGGICKEVLYCAKKAGVTHILKAGGAQAIAAMAWGTTSCPKVIVAS
ncbi:Histidinol dehydrogenase, chloroplastic [Vitis vinifera]|uniref:Histidinol dehydrogenase, chloroplastic n=1 Tax=Vitis vinifera TaxID=29760 RepID=A0A438DNP1_VITVI|nr:Histidinol dehydrogenase, chloroplastic [Vitis vinifera]